MRQLSLGWLSNCCSKVCVKYVLDWLDQLGRYTIPWALRQCEWCVEVGTVTGPSRNEVMESVK